MGDVASSAVVAINGRLMAQPEASVSAFDHGLTVGDGVFETLQVVRGAAFAVRRHLDRLRRSLDGLGIELPISDHDLRATMAAVVEANRLDRGRLRLTVTGGIGPLGSDRGTTGPTVVVAATELAVWEPATAVITVPWTRNERSAVAGLKTTSYAENVVALDHAHRAGASEAIFANTVGQVCEGTGSNLFLGVGGRLVTPPLSSGCLAGITRQLVCELVEVDQRDLAMTDLATVDEAFLTSSTRDVQAVASIDGRPLRAPGPLTRSAATAFADLLARDLDP
jgi:branched-chain amino acid aminotransferase